MPIVHLIADKTAIEIVNIDMVFDDGNRYPLPDTIGCIAYPKSHRHNNLLPIELNGQCTCDRRRQHYTMRSHLVVSIGILPRKDIFFFTVSNITQLSQVSICICIIAITCKVHTLYLNILRQINGIGLAT